MKGTIIITEDGRQAGAIEQALQQAGLPSRRRARCVRSRAGRRLVRLGGRPSLRRRARDRGAQRSPARFRRSTRSSAVTSRACSRPRTGNKTLAARILGGRSENAAPQALAVLRESEPRGMQENGVSHLPADRYARAVLVR
jgi:hypothetical protein